MLSTSNLRASLVLEHFCRCGLMREGLVIERIEVAEFCRRECFMYSVNQCHSIFGQTIDDKCRPQWQGVVERRGGKICAKAVKVLLGAVLECHPGDWGTEAFRVVDPCCSRFTKPDSALVVATERGGVETDSRGFNLPVRSSDVAPRKDISSHRSARKIRPSLAKQPST